MTSIKHYDIFGNPNRAKHYTAKKPSKGALGKARRNLLGAVNFHGCGQLAQFMGPPSKTFSGNDDCNFYIVFPVIDPPGDADKINIGADLLCWDEASSNIGILWDGVNDPNSPYAVAIGNTQDGSTPPAGFGNFFTNEVAYDQNAVTTGNAVYGYTKFEVDGCPVAYMSAYTIPRTTANYRADEAASGSFDQQFGIKNDAFNIDMPLLGTNDYDSVDGSLGALCQHQNAQDKSNASLVASSAPCVFQYAHPAGVYVTGSGISTFNNVFGEADINGTTRPTVIRVRGRELDTYDTGDAQYDKPLDLAVVARWDANVTNPSKLKITVYEAGADTTTATPIDTQTHTFSTAGAASPTMEVNDAFVTYRPSGCDIVFEAASDSSDAIEFQTIALFERSMGDSV